MTQWHNGSYVFFDSLCYVLWYCGKYFLLTSHLSMMWFSVTRLVILCRSNWESYHENGKGRILWCNVLRYLVELKRNLHWQTWNRIVTELPTRVITNFGHKRAAVLWSQCPRCFLHTFNFSGENWKYAYSRYERVFKGFLSLNILKSCVFNGR